MWGNNYLILYCFLQVCPLAKNDYIKITDIYGRLRAPETPVPVIVGTCTLPSEVCQ